MKVVFDSVYAVLDAIEEAANLAKLGYPAPPEFGKANCFINPLGESPGRGWILLQRATLDKIDLNTYHTLTFETSTVNSVTLQNLIIEHEPRCLTPGKENDPTACYMVPLVDERGQLGDPQLLVALEAYYNIRAPGYNGSYYASSTNSGTAWTWNLMVGNIWASMPQLGTYPGLPFTPDGTPEGWSFPGVSAYHALNAVLYRLGCAIKWNPILLSNPYSIVQIGADDSTSEAIITDATNQGRKIFDSAFLNTDLGNVPGYCRVFFHRMEENYGNELTTPQTSSQWVTGSVYSVDVAADTSFNGLVDENLIHPIWDDLPAIYDPTGSLTNSAALNTRAAERAADYYRMIDPGGDRMQKMFSGVLVIQPGSLIKGVAWRQDLGGIGGADAVGGIITEVIRHPFWMLRVTDNAGWEPMELHNATSIRPPDFAPTYPNYPQIFQKIRLTTGTADGSGRFTAFVERYNPTARTWSDGEACYAVDDNGATTATSGNRYPGRLSGYDTSLPVYSISQGGSGGGATVQPAQNIAVTVGSVNNNVNLTSGYTFYRFTGSGSQQTTITGLLYNAGAPSDGQMFEIENDTNQPMTFIDGSGSSTYPFNTSLSEPVTIAPGAILTFKFNSSDGTNNLFSPTCSSAGYPEFEALGTTNTFEEVVPLRWSITIPDITLETDDWLVVVIALLTDGGMSVTSAEWDSASFGPAVPYSMSDIGGGSSLSKYVYIHSSSGQITGGTGDIVVEMDSFGGSYLAGACAVAYRVRNANFPVVGITAATSGTTATSAATSSTSTNNLALSYVAMNVGPNATQGTWQNDYVGELDAMDAGANVCIRSAYKRTENPGSIQATLATFPTADWSMMLQPYVPNQAAGCCTCPTTVAPQSDPILDGTGPDGLDVKPGPRATIIDSMASLYT